MSHTLRMLSILAASALVFSCAKRPDAIVAVSIPSSAYEVMECPQLSAELLKERDKLAALSKSQNQAATADAVGVFLVAVPAGSLVGADKEGEIAASKGKIQAMETAMIAKKC